MGAPLGDFGAKLQELYQQVGNAGELSRMYERDRAMHSIILHGGLRAFWLEGLRRMQKSWCPTGWTGSLPSFKAELYARLGENDRAIEALNKTYETRSHLMTQLKVNPAFDGLRSDPRFAELLRRMKLS